LKKEGLAHHFEETLVPTHEVTEVKKGKRTTSEKKYFPGYFLAKLDMNDQVYHLIKIYKKNYRIFRCSRKAHSNFRS
jgi:transcription termination/antitermination protein NusG